MMYHLFKHQVQAKALNSFLGNDNYIAKTQRKAIRFLTYLHQYITTPYACEEFGKHLNKLGYLFAGFILPNTKLIPFMDKNVEAIYWTEDKDFIYITAKIKSDVYL